VSLSWPRRLEVALSPTGAAWAGGTAAGAPAEAFAAAREVFQEVDDALGQKLFAIMGEGPDDQLTLTENAQPAIMAHAIAVLQPQLHGIGIGLQQQAATVQAQRQAPAARQPGRQRTAPPCEKAARARPAGDLAA